MANGKITKELKNLGLKMNGKEPTGDTTSEVINGIANDLQGDNIVIEVEDITGLTNEQCEALKCGDVVNKITGTQKHSYKVSYKENNVGMCLTYIDASVSETVSYDKTGDNWVYNSTDVTELGGSGGTTVVANPTLAGTEAELTGLQVGDTKYAVPQGGGATLYMHIVKMYYTDSSGEAIIRKDLWYNLITTSETAFTLETFKQKLASISFGAVNGGVIATMGTTVDNGVMETQAVVTYAKINPGVGLDILINSEDNKFEPAQFADRVVAL